MPKDMQPWAALHRADFDRLSSRTTAELQSALKTHTDGLLDRPSGEAGAYHRLWVDRIQELLAERDHSDHNAPLAVKERIWAAQKEYTPLFVERVRLEKWLARSKRTIFKSKDQVRAVQVKLANIKARMEELALITGATLPQHNPIRDWSFEQKFSRAAEIALRSGKLAPEIAEELRAAIQFPNLARSAAMMAALAAAHAYPLAGFAADAILLAHVGVDGALTGHRIYLEINSIQSEADLNAAADVLRKELASQAAGKVTNLLTWGTGKGAAAFNKRYKITIDRDKVRRLSTGEMPLSPNPKNLIPLKVVKRTGRTGWMAPKGWNGPSAKKGTWQGNRGDSGWIDNRPKVIKITKGEPIPFVKGKIIFDKWVQATFRVPGVKGGKANRAADTALIYKAIFHREKLGAPGVKFSWSKHRNVVTKWLKKQPDGFGGRGLSPHHAGGDKLQYVPKKLHLVQHTDIDA